MIQVDELVITVKCDICGKEIPTNTDVCDTESKNGITPRGTNNIMGEVTVYIVLEEGSDRIELIDKQLYCARCRELYYNELRIIESNYKSLKESLPTRVKRIVESDDNGKP